MEPVSERQKYQEELGFASSSSTDGAFHLNAGKYLYPVLTGKEKAFLHRGYDEKSGHKDPGATQTQPLHWLLESRGKPGSGCNKTML